MSKYGKNFTYGKSRYKDLSSSLIVFNDCLLGSVANISDATLNNCALSLPPAVGTLTHCQIGWTQPPVPTWDGYRSLFNNYVLAAGVHTPPEPGKGYPSYLGYETGLWGTPRLGIGAVDFFGLTTTTTTSSPVTITYTNSTFITAIQNQIKLSGMMTCIGWIKSPLMEDGDSLIPLAVSDPYGNVLNTDASLKFEILRQGRDYRLQYLGSKSKVINKNIKIKIDDGNWHMLSYESDKNGNMTYSVDGLLLASEDGIDQYGLPYSVAKSLTNRVGGGKVWAPFLYKQRQIIYMYNWRFGKNFNLGLKWIRELMNIDKNILGIS